MQKNPATQFIISIPRILFACTLCFVGLFLTTLSFATLPQLPFGKTDVAGPGWASFMIHTDGSIVRVKLWATSPQSPNVLGSFFYDEQEEFLGGFDFSVHRSETGVTADINVIPGNPVNEHITIMAQPEGGFGMTATYNPNGVPSTFKLLVFGAGRQVSWSYDGGDNPADVRLLGIDTGASAFLYLSDDFFGPANSTVRVVGAGTHVTLMADLTVDAVDTLIANWLPISDASVDRKTVTTPRGEEECLYAGVRGCSWPRFHGDTAQGPGRYIFHLTGSGAAALQNSDQAMLYGADARLPIDQTLIVPPTLASVVSRKTHGSSGDFDIDLPLTGNPGIECRSGEANGNYTMVFTFPNNTSVTSASVTSGTGTVSSSSLGPNPNQYTVNLTGVTNAQYLIVTLNGALDSAGNRGNVVGPRMGVLVGDVNASGVVTSGDTNLCKAQALQTVSTTNFRNDINASGAITTGDVNIIKQNALSQLPP